MTKAILLISSMFFLGSAYAQMHIQSGATVFISAGAKVTLQGDLTGLADIQGLGTVTMKGSSQQNINMNGFTIPNLEIDNPAHVTLTGGNTRIGSNLLFVNGQLQTGNLDLLIAAAATFTGHNSSRFINTNGTGQVRKELTADVTNTEIPIGEGSNYRPVYITTSGSNYSSANLGVRVVNGATPNRPPMIGNFLTAYWPVSRTGITGGTVTVAGQYIDPTDVSGTEANLSGYYFNGTDWTSVSATNDGVANRVSAPVTDPSGELYGMNRFVAVGTRAFLQGAYNSATGLMSDALRTGTNVIPVSDPYRTAPYSTSFLHINNATTETAPLSVFNNQALPQNDIVDWVFLELRNNVSPGGSVFQTRSALIQRDGDIVDIDGVSPVTFNQPNGSYTITVRHRNHLGIASNPSTPRVFSETKSIAFTTNLADLRVGATPLFSTAGTGYTTSTHPVLGTVNLLWGGNANPNGTVRYTSLGNDKDYILLTTLGGNPSTVVSNVYSPSDLNMNKVVRYNALANDKDFLFINVLQSTTTTIRTQQIPN